MTRPETPDQYVARMGALVEQRMAAVGKRREELEAKLVDVAREEAGLRDICPHDKRAEERMGHEAIVTCVRCGENL
jgi:hypothetical protein